MTAKEARERAESGKRTLMDQIEDRASLGEYSFEQYALSEDVVWLRDLGYTVEVIDSDPRLLPLLSFKISW
jgi:hypothetical protein